MNRGDERDALILGQKRRVRRVLGDAHELVSREIQCLGGRAEVLADVAAEVRRIVAVDRDVYARAQQLREVVLAQIFDDAQLQHMMELARKGVRDLIAQQRAMLPTLKVSA